MPDGRKVALKIAMCGYVEEDMLLDEASTYLAVQDCGTRAFLSFYWLATCVRSAAAMAWAPLYFLGGHYSQVWAKYCDILLCDVCHNAGTRAHVMGNSEPRRATTFAALQGMLSCCRQPVPSWNRSTVAALSMGI